MKRKLPWKKLFWVLVVLAAFCLLAAEFGAAFFFLAGVFAVGVIGGLVRIWWTARREKRDREDAETRREAQRDQAIQRRREQCRVARYDPAERAAAEAHLQAVLGPAAAWDLEEDADVLRIDAALVPPSEELPYWKAATLGAGAYVMEPGGYVINPFRAELVMALPPDWDPADRWPVRLLRDAARCFLVSEGFVGYGSLYRGFSAVSAGFAGAVATDGFPGLPDLGLALLPAPPGLSFFWLVPLLKPELDYFQQRGLAGLERRFPAENPWADSGRKPLADPLTWFEEDIAPFAWSQEGELYCLGLEFGEWRQELFYRAGFTDLFKGWEKLAREYLRKYQPEDEPFVDFACEERLFFAASRDEEIMRAMAVGLSELVRYRVREAQRLLY